MIYYNENDPNCAAWLEQLIADGHLPDGWVDDRSIEDVRPDELIEYTQCHFFAGVGGWPLALQLAGWPNDRPVWTGSCPCQPYSNAGAGAGNDDPRNLWWCYRWLIQQCRPPVVFGEQVASKAGRQWLAGVQTDLQAMGYDTAGADLCAASVGAPHIRQRLWWVGYSKGDDQQRSSEPAMHGEGVTAGRSSGDGRVGHTVSQGSQGHAWHGRNGHEPGRNDAPEAGSAAQAGGDSGVADAECCGGHHGRRLLGRCDQEGKRGEKAKRGEPGQQAERDSASDSLRALWSESNLIPCADGKQRRIESGTQPLVDGIPRGMVPKCDPGAPGYAQNTGEARKMRLHGYGNAIVPHVAAEFIVATCEVAA